MAFGITRKEIIIWKQAIDEGHFAFITHYWLDDRFPNMNTVTKVGCKDLDKLARWGQGHGLRKEWIHHRVDGYSHYDLLGSKQTEIFRLLGEKKQLGVFVIKMDENWRLLQ
ncbi:hypothetical protein [Bacillus sp. FJAT-50079]|uniref:hypothetical protein n=1 Tax=Bacillus sp. FJAT-50079 TaxID=2833577 RepID=UPI001BC97AC8|nr:hypothetical protein [Bacillus sp. FJAT-50079]MBS4207414.1 hypothetical protein [Bacillus sp. FJAT-50079]